MNLLMKLPLQWLQRWGLLHGNKESMQVYFHLPIHQWQQGQQ